MRGFIPFIGIIPQVIIKSSRRPCSTTEPNKSAEHSAIQEGCVHCSTWLQLMLVACCLPHDVAAAFVISAGPSLSVYNSYYSLLKNTEMMNATVRCVCSKYLD